jgi:L-ornithine Nalpha-acyltransferase
MDDHRTEISGLSVRLARNAADLAAAQRLRFQVFAEEGGAPLQGRHDRDAFDQLCDHLLVIENRGVADDRFAELALDDGSLVGTYRLLRQDVLSSPQDFYTAHEFDIVPLIAAKPDLRFMELGRSCVRSDKRDLPVVELLWQGIWNYVREHAVDVMMGCASFDGVDADQHKHALSYLAHHARAPEDWRVSAHDHKRVEMRRIAAETLDTRAIRRSLPPLIKGYLGLGCYIGEDAVIDRAFNSIDVLILLPVAAINPRYFQRFGAPITN